MFASITAPRNTTKSIHGLHHEGANGLGKVISVQEGLFINISPLSLNCLEHYTEYKCLATNNEA